MPEQSTSTQPLQLQIPLVWQMQLETIAQRTGQTLEQMVYQAIGHYLGQSSGQSLSQLELRSPKSAPDEGLKEEDFEDEPDEILTSFLESDDFQERVRQAIAPQSVDQSADRSPYEEIEHEPDEILYGFLEP